MHCDEVEITWNVFTILMFGTLLSLSISHSPPLFLLFFPVVVRFVVFSVDAVYFLSRIQYGRLLLAHGIEQNINGKHARSIWLHTRYSEGDFYVA